MPPRRSSALAAPLLALAVYWLSGCATTPRPGPAAAPAPVEEAPKPEEGPAAAPEEGPAEPVGETGGAPPAGAVHPVAGTVVEWLARRLRIEPAAVEVVQIAFAEWPDACLGLPAEDEICAMMITPGYAVSLLAGGQRYELRTDLEARRVRIASAPLVETGNPLVVHRDAGSFSLLVIGTQRVAFGRRGRPLLVAPLAVPERARELEGFLARFAPFQEATPVGDVSFAGVGPQPANAAERRMIGEWARLVAAEAEGGLTGPAVDRAIAWRRSGGTAGVCEAIVIGRSGAATAFACRDGVDVVRATIRLDPAELEQLYRWIDRLEAFSWTSAETVGGAEGPVIALEFEGDGLEPVTLAERDRIVETVHGLLARLITAAQRS